MPQTRIIVYQDELGKEGKIPDVDIERAIRRKKTFGRDPARHTYEEDINDG